MPKVVIVETVTMTRQRYLIELGENDENVWACDSIVSKPDNLRAVGEKVLDEVIVTHRELTSDEVLAIITHEHPETNGWSDRLKYDMYVTKDH